jgi:hypothetical protein
VKSLQRFRWRSLFEKVARRAFSSSSFGLATGSRVRRCPRSTYSAFLEPPGEGELGSYIEYGLFDRLTLITQPFSKRRGRAARLANFGATVVSIQGLLHIPFDSGQLPQAGFDEDDAFSGDLRLLLGHTFEVDGAPGFLDLQGGYRWQDDGEPNEWHADFTAGARPQPHLLVMLQSFATLADRSTAVCEFRSSYRKVWSMISREAGRCRAASSRRSPA